MKTKLVAVTSILFLVFFASGCQSGGTGGTETGTTDSGKVDPTVLGGRIEASASTLVPYIAASEVGALKLSDLSALTFGTDEEWSTYLDPDNAYLLTDVFGNPDEEPRVVTKIRVLLDQFRSTVEGIFSEDPEFACLGGSSLSSEGTGDTIEIAFYGATPNGTAENRFFDCLSHGSDHEENEETILYGEDGDGIVRFVTMFDQTSTNTEEVATRGISVRIRSVIYATYGERSEEGNTVTYLDLQYAQATSYNGIDETFGSSDDVIFKSRSRISGRVVLDASGEPVSGSGDFAVTKYDRGGSNITVTKTLGRGNFGDNQFSLFKIESNAGDLSDLSRTFCIQMAVGDSGLPGNALSENCSDFEGSYAWGDVTIPFTLTPEIEEAFDEKPFFEGDDSDLIADDGNNFTIPTFE
jgi:hypothetical protein